MYRLLQINALNKDKYKPFKGHKLVYQNGSFDSWSQRVVTLPTVTYKVYLYFCLEH